MSGLHFEAYVDFAKLDKDIEKMDRKLTDLVGDLKGTGREATSIFNNLGAGLATYFSAQALGGFTRELVNVRGEFQQLEVAFETMLGSKSKADALMSQVVNLAGTTPFSLTEVAAGAKQLLAVQVPAEEVEDTLRRIGDVSAGLSVPISQLIKAYGDTKAKTRLMGEEMRQFMGAGIPMVAELAKHFNVAEKEISKMVESGQVGFEDVRAVLNNLTDEGGMFNDLMAKQSKTLTGLVSNLGDAWDRMLNDIGQQNEGGLSDGIKTAISLVENYEKVVDVLKVAIATYGAYKAAVMLNAVATNGLTGALKGATAAQHLFNLASKANPVGLAMAGLTAIIGALYVYTKRTREAATASQEVNKSITEETSKLNYLFEAIKRTGEGTEERKKLIGEVNEKYGDYLDNLLTEKSTLQDIEKAQRIATRALMADIAVKESRRKIDEELSDYTETLQKKFNEFSSVVSKMSPAVHAEFLQDLNRAIEEQADTAGDELKTGMLQYSSIAKEVYDKYISSISRQSGFLKYDFSSFQKAFFDVAGVRVEKNKVINELNGYVDAYQQIFDRINQPTSEEDPAESIRKDVEYWEKERKIAKEALDKLTKEDADFIENQNRFLNRIDEAEREINIIRGKKEKEKERTLTDSINSQIEAWERYYRFVEHGHEDLASKQSEALKGTANSLRDYLLEVEGQLTSSMKVLDPSSDAYREAADALSNVRSKRVELDGGKSVLDQYKETVEKQKVIFQEYEEWRGKFGEEQAKERFAEELKGFDSYISYLESEMKKYEGRTDPTGISQRFFLAEEKTSTESDRRKRTQEALGEVLLETQSHQEKLAALELEFQTKLKFIEGEGNEDRRAKLKDIYDKKRQDLQASHMQEMESYTWVFESLDRMNRKALKDYIQRLREELKQTKYQSAEMLQVRLQLEEKLAQAEQKLSDNLPDRLRDVGAVLRDAAALAGEFDESLAKAITTAADLADAASSIAQGFASGNPFQMVSGILQASLALVKLFSKKERAAKETEKLVAWVERMNAALERQARLIRGYGVQNLEAYTRVLKLTAEQLEDVEKKMSKYAEGLQRAKGTDIYNDINDLGLLDKEVSEWSQQDWLNVINAASGETKKKLEALYNQWVDLQNVQDEYFQQWAEYATGMSFDGFVDEFVEALKAGERSASDFADNIEDMLRNAIIQGFKTQVIMKQLEPLYEEFANMAEDGLTEDEIRQFVASAGGLFESIGKEWELFTSALQDAGISMSTDTANTLKGAFKSLTEETGNILAGRLNSIHLTVNAHLDIARRAILHQAETAANTRRLENVEYYLRDIKKSLTSGDSSIKTKRAGGM